MLEEETLIREEREGEPWRIAMVKVVLVEKMEQDAQRTGDGGCEERQRCSSTWRGCCGHGHMDSPQQPLRLRSVPQGRVAAHLQKF